MTEYSARETVNQQLVRNSSLNFREEPIYIP